jgi:hypothetical protein
MYDVPGGVVSGERKISKTDPEYKAWKVWFASIARAVGAVEWGRSGGTNVKIAVGIPCAAIGVVFKGEIDVSGTSRHHAQADTQPIFQVDICLLHPDGYAFSLFVKSFGIVRLTLASALRYVTSHLSISIYRLETSYTPYPGLPAIVIALSTSPAELCQWLGLDHLTWQKGFANEEALYAWLVTVKKGSFLDQAHSKMGREKRDVKHAGVKNDTKVGGWKAFLEWMRDALESPYRAPAGLAITPAPLVIQLPVEASQNIDPEAPLPLDPLAKETIVRFGKWTEFEEAMVERKHLATIRAMQQKKRNKPIVVEPYSSRSPAQEPSTSSATSTLVRKISSLSLGSRPHTPVVFQS